MPELVEIHLPSGTRGTVTVNGADLSNLVSALSLRAGVRERVSVTLHLAGPPVYFKGEADTLLYHDCPDCCGHGVMQIVGPKEGPE